jgi:hypothetical protein
MGEYSWSKIEKKEARRIFDKALQKECDIMIERSRDFDAMATSIQDLASINNALLLTEGNISRSDLDVFSTDKVEQIVSMADFIKNRR